MKKLFSILLIICSFPLFAQYYVTDGYGKILAYKGDIARFRPSEYQEVQRPIWGALAWYPLNGNFNDSLGFHNGTEIPTSACTFPDDTAVYFPSGGNDGWDCGLVIPDGCDTFTISYLANYATDDNSIYTEYSTVLKYQPDTAGYFSSVDGTSTGYYNWTMRVQDADGNQTYATTDYSNCQSITPDDTWVHVVHVWRKVSTSVFNVLIFVNGQCCYCGTSADSTMNTEGQLYGQNLRIGTDHHPTNPTTGLADTYYDNVMIFRGDLRYNPDGNYMDTIFANPYTMPMIGGKEQPPTPPVPTAGRYDIAHDFHIYVPEGEIANNRLYEMSPNRNYIVNDNLVWTKIGGSSDFSISDSLLYSAGTLTWGNYYVKYLLEDGDVWDTAGIWITVTDDIENIYCDLDASTNGTGSRANPYNYPHIIPGKYIYLKRGTSYTFNDQWLISNDDSWHCWTYGNGERPEIQLNYRTVSQGNLHIVTCDNWDFGNIEFRNTQTVYPSITVMTTGSMINIGFDNCIFHGDVGGSVQYDTCAFQLLRLGGSETSQIQNGFIRNCQFYNSWDDAIYTFALRGDSPASMFEWESNYIYNTNLLGVEKGGGGDCVQFDSDAAGSDTRYNHFIHNLFSKANNIGKHGLLYECYGSFLTGSNTGTIIERNRFEGTDLDSDSYAQNDLTLSCARGTVVRYNVFNGATRGVALWSESPYNTDPFLHYIQIYGNLFNHNQRYCIHVHDGGADYLHVYNNTFANYEELGIYLETGNPGSDFRNNIFTWYGSYGSISAISGTATTEDYNLFYPDAGLFSPAGGHEIEGEDPLFGTGSDSQFEVGNISPAYHAGTNVGLTVDLWGTTWGSTPTLGYKEYTGKEIIPNASWPLNIYANKYLVDGYGDPYLLMGGTPWRLINELNSTVNTYLDDREAKDFRALMVLLVGNESSDPRNKYGDAPWTTGHEFEVAYMNEAYWTHADEVIQNIYDRDMTVMLFPAYLGWQGSSTDGWYTWIITKTYQQMYDYGEWIANRYAEYDNIVWVVGGDYAPHAAIEEIRAMVEGILSIDGNANVWTAHNARYESGFTKYDAQDKSWMTLNSTYASGENLSYYLQQDYNRDSVYFTIEGWYEGEHSFTGVMGRSQIYWTMFGGATGFFFGNNPIYFFESGWEAALDLEGSQDMETAITFIDTIDWWNATPDYAHTVLTSGASSIGTSTYASCMRVDDGSAIYAYTPTSRTLTVDLTKITATSGCDAWWVNPSTLALTPIGFYANDHSEPFTCPSSRDWILMILKNDAGPPSEYYQDNFDSYANGSSINGQSYWLQEVGDIRVYSSGGDGEIYPSATGYEVASYYNQTVNADQYAQSVCSALSSGYTIGPAVRISGSSTGDYYGFYSNPHAAYLFRCDGGSYVELARGDPWVVNDVVKLEVTGTGATVTLKVYKNGVLDTSFDTDGIYDDTDANRKTSGYVGVCGYSLQTAVRIDNWVGGSQ